MNSYRPLLPLLAAAVAVAAVYGMRSAGWRLTWSGSVPRGLYRVVDRPFERGDLVLVCLPPEVGRWAKGRGYLAGGDCPGRVAPIGKPVAALSGDRVTVRSEHIAINGRPLERSQRSTLDSAGRPIPWARDPHDPLAPGELWLHSPHHARSLDSRIFGPLRTGAVREVLVPVLVEGP